MPWKDEGLHSTALDKLGKDAFPSDDFMPDGFGRNGKFQQFGLKLVWPTGPDGIRRCRTILYGSICDDIMLEEKNNEGQILFYYANGQDQLFRCTIHGIGLDALHDSISEGKRMRIGIGASNRDEKQRITGAEIHEKDEEGNWVLVQM